MKKIICESPVSCGFLSCLRRSLQSRRQRERAIVATIHEVLGSKMDKDKGADHYICIFL